jgi:LacI family transcriptional regulator
MKMQDVARLAGVSTATISRVLNEPGKVSEPTRKKVQKILDQTHYVANAVARGLVLSSMRTIGILTNDVTSHYIATVVYTIEQRLVELGYNVILTNDGGVLEVKKRSLKMILEKQADGIIMVGSMYKEKHDNSHLIQAAQKVPILIVNNYFAVKNSYGIVSDDLLGVQNAVSYLVELGHRDIYYLCDSDTPAACAKLKGFQQGMRVYGLDESNWMDIPRAMQAGNDGLRQLLARGKRVTAVICGEDLTAVGVMKACAQLKLSVPGDISVIGYNNSILAEAATPALTSIDNHTEEIALAAADKLRDILQGKPVQKKTVFTPGLFVRESTGPVKR